MQIGWQKYLQIVSIAALLFQCVLPAGAQEFNDRRYATYRTWALAPPWAEDPLKIISFIPESYLLYLANTKTYVVSNQDYWLALTQDGVQVLIDPKSVSELSFRESVGDHQVIFNADYLLCKTVGCDAKLGVDWLVARGEAFRIASSGQNSTTLLGTRKGETVEGFIPRAELDHLTQIGKVTRADEVHPRYRIEKYQSEALATSCGESRQVGSQITAPDDNIAKAILNLIPVAKVEGDHIEIVSAYGGSDYRNKFYLYRVSNRLNPNTGTDQFDVAVAVKIKCSDSVENGVGEESYIEHMTLVNSKNVFNGRSIPAEISMDLFNTPRDLRAFTGDAYMISINKPEHFERALEILTNRIGDRELSGYLLTELNRSCRSELRNIYSNSKCISYDY